ncbi:hypothetical protein [Ornithinibacillus xuwenensis]
MVECNNDHHVYEEFIWEAYSTLNLLKSWREDGPIDSHDLKNIQIHFKSMKQFNGSKYPDTTKIVESLRQTQSLLQYTYQQTLVDEAITQTEKDIYNLIIKNDRKILQGC